MKEVGFKKVYGNTLFLTAILGIIGFFISVFGGQYLNDNAGWLFGSIGSLLTPFPPSYRSGSFVAQWTVYAFWFLLGGLVLALFARARGRLGKTTGNSKFKSGPRSRR